MVIPDDVWRPEAGAPASIVIEPVHPKLWRFTILDRDGHQLDYSLSSSRGLAWRMAKFSWRRLR